MLAALSVRGMRIGGGRDGRLTGVSPETIWA